MFKAEIKSDTLKGLVNIVSTLIDEVKFTVGPEGISLKAVDPAHVAMVEVNIDAAAFESYSADETTIGLDLDKVKGVLKLASSGDIISMEQDEDHGKLVFRVGNITRRMHLVDTSGMSDPRFPQLSLSSKIDILVEELQQGIRASESISDHIALTVNSQGFELSCEGDTDSASLIVSKDKLKSMELPDGDTAFRSLFPLDYFANLVKAIPTGTTVGIELDSDYPIKMNFSFAEGNGKVSYLLAPRIESD